MNIYERIQIKLYNVDQNINIDKFKQVSAGCSHSMAIDINNKLEIIDDLMIDH